MPSARLVGRDGVRPTVVKPPVVAQGGDGGGRDTPVFAQAGAGGGLALVKPVTAQAGAGGPGVVVPKERRIEVTRFECTSQPWHPNPKYK